MRSQSVLLDLDNTVWDLTTPWIERLNEKFCTNVDPESLTDYDITKAFPFDVGKNECLSVLRDRTVWNRVEPYPGAIKAMSKINEICDLFIVTKVCSTEEAFIKINKLKRIAPFICLDQVIITGNKKMINGDIIIDDCMQYVTTGTRKARILIDKPYNMDIKHTDNKIIRVKDLVGALAIVNLCVR